MDLWHSVVQIKKNEMSGTCSMYGVKGEVYAGFRCGDLKEIHHQVEPVVDGRIKLKGIFKKWDGA